MLRLKASILLGALLLATPAHAQQTTLVSPGQSPRTSPFQISLATDLQLTVTGLALSLAPIAFADHRAAPPADQLSRGSLNAMDRTVIGNHSAAADLTSDALLASHLVLPHLVNLLDVWHSSPADGFNGLAADSLVLLETYSVTTILCNLVKYGVRRPRPYVYDQGTSDAQRQETTATLSFFSGHTALSFSMASAYSYLYSRRHPDSAMRWAVWLGTHALAATTGVTRVLAGKHFWSDVMVGAAVGSAVGLAVPYLHEAAGRQLFGNWRAVADVRVLPTFQDGGWGITAMVLW